MTVSRRTVLAVLSWLLSAVAFVAYADEQGKAKPVNLQVLPEDLSGARLGKLMKRYEQDLGVSCSHCHVENPQTQKIDYVSDENPRKQTARVMIAMVRDINEKYLAQLGSDSRYAVPVTCGSCHQGQNNPPAFEGKGR